MPEKPKLPTVKKTKINRKPTSGEQKQEI